MQNSRLLNLDAINRAVRTVYQIVVVSVLVDVIPMLIEWTNGDDALDTQGLTKAAIRSALAGLLAYLMRRHGDGNRFVPTPLPPSPQPEPNDDV